MQQICAPNSSSQLLQLGDYLTVHSLLPWSFLNSAQFPGTKTFINFKGKPFAGIYWIIKALPGSILPPKSSGRASFMNNNEYVARKGDSIFKSTLKWKIEIFKFDSAANVHNLKYTASFVIELLKGRQSKLEKLDKMQV